MAANTNGFGGGVCYVTFNHAPHVPTIKIQFLAESATYVEENSEDTLQEAKRTRTRVQELYKVIYLQSPDYCRWLVYEHFSSNSFQKVSGRNFRHTFVPKLLFVPMHLFVPKLLIIPRILLIPWYKFFSSIVRCKNG